MKIVSVVGARPNFMKIAPFMRAIDEYNKSNPDAPVEHTLVHTGQHYDDRMSQAFFEALNIPAADINLGVGSGTHAEQVGQTMIEFEKVLRKIKPDWVVVVGDVNATLACSVTAKKEHVKCCHIEAGLRSGDLKMPEEINRLVTDRLSDLLLIPDKLSGDNLRKEGRPESSIKFVGNIMIDTLEENRGKAGNLRIEEIIRRNRIEYGVSDTLSQIPGQAGNDRSGGVTSPKPTSKGDPYVVLTLHRPSNVDQRETLEPIVNFLCDEVAAEMILMWTLHPRTEKNLKNFGLWDKVIATENIMLLHPINYHEMLRLNMDAKMILTDSGGLQEECTVLGTPCITLRWNTERPITLREHGGASVIVGNDINHIRKEFQETLLLERKPFRPELWDGRTAERCLKEILEYREENGE
jgi:UDP-N-acetylglucosamine 2-epimerase (non-hydrolysing)